MHDLELGNFTNFKMLTTSADGQIAFFLLRRRFSLERKSLIWSVKVHMIVFLFGLDSSLGYLRGRKCCRSNFTVVRTHI